MTEDKRRRYSAPVFDGLGKSASPRHVAGRGVYR